jgi:hypothetical protein
MDDGREGLSEIDRALAAALDVDVSPDFVARVRQRIAREPEPVPFWRGWRIALPAAAVAMLLVAVGIRMLLQRAPSTPPLVARSLSVQPLQPAEARPIAPAVAIGTPVTVKRSRSAPVPAIAATEPEVLVPREEIEMYRRLIAAAGRVPHAPMIEAPQVIGSARQISEITIDPIKIDLIMPPIGGEGDRQ